MRVKRAYLDIETTGLSPLNSRLTVIGIGLEFDVNIRLHQLFGDDLTSEAVCNVLQDVERLYTYNGNRFDLPFIKSRLKVDIKRVCRHTDLMYSCWRQGLKGGLKRVEQVLGITRELPDVGGLDAVRWWMQYERNGDAEALDLLLRYNGEDVENLKKLREWLNVS